MAKYIDADKLLPKIKYREKIYGLVSNMFSKHGEWVVEDIADEDEYNGDSAYIDVHCSKCSFSACLETGEYQWYYGKDFPWNYCPNCGAKMDGKDGEQNENHTIYAF